MTRDPFKEIINNDLKQEVPSFDFTQSVMDKIELSIEEKKVVKPLIPKKWMTFIVMLYILIFALPLVLLVNELNFSFLDGISFYDFNILSFKEPILLVFKLSFVFTALLLSEKLFFSKKLWT